MPVTHYRHSQHSRHSRVTDVHDIHDMTTPKKAADCYRADNETCARLVLADLERYGGPDSLMCQWARVIIERAQPTIKGPLFINAA